MSSISPAPQGEVGQSHLSRHTGLGSEVRGEPSAADARGVHARHSTLQSVTATTTRTQTQPRMVQSSPSTPHEGVTGAAGRDFANQSVPIYGLDSRMPPSASSSDVTNSDAYTTPAPLACAFGNPTTGTASGAPPTTTDGLSSTRLHFPATIASERSLSITSPSSLGTSASTTSFNTASATPYIQRTAQSVPINTTDGVSATRLQSLVPAAFERDSSITSPSSLGTPASATSFNSASANLSSAAATRLQLEASFDAKLDNIVADITNLVDNLRKVGSIPTPPVTKVQSDAIQYLTGRLHNIPTLIRLFNLVLVNDLVTSLFVVEATSMSDDELLASCTLPFISEWAERALTSHMEVLLDEAGIPLVYHSPFQQFAALIVAQNLPLDSFLPTFLAERYPDFTQGEWTTIMDRASRTLRGIFNNGTSPSFCVWAHGGIDASGIVQQVLDGYTFDRVRTQRLLCSSLGDDVRPDRGRDGGGTAFGSFILPCHPPPSSNSSLPHGKYPLPTPGLTPVASPLPPPTLEPLASSADFDARVAAAVAARVDAAVAMALRARGVSPPPMGSISPGRGSPFDEHPPSPSRGFDLKGLTSEVAVRECLAENFTTPPVWYGHPPPPGRVDGSTNSPAAWSTLLHQICVQLLKGREFNTRSQTFSNPVSKFEADVKRVLTDPDSYRLCRPSLHEALARLFLTKGVHDSATKKEATQYVMQQLESTLPKSPPKGCLHYSLEEVQRFLLHSMSHRDDTDDDADASLLQFLHMLDNFYLSQTVSDPYNDFSSMHWSHSVTWVEYVVDLKRFAERHRYFQRLNSSGHKGSAPVNMDATQVFLRQIVQTLQRCMIEDGNDSVAAELFTLYSTTLNLSPQQLLDDLERRPKLKNACRTTPQVPLDNLALRAPTSDEESDFGIDTE